ncbi:DUF7673 family protein [Cupriavidus necator]
MNTPSQPKAELITHEVPAHLVGAFLEAVEEFFGRAHGGHTSAQRAAEIRAQDHDAGLDSLAYLVNFAEGNSRQAGAVARFLIGLDNGLDFPFNLTDLRELDADLFEHCLALLRLNYNATVDIHQYFPDGDELFQGLIRHWHLDQCPPPPPARQKAARYQARYVTCRNVSGYRDASLAVCIEAGAARQQPFALQFSARDTGKIAQHLLDIHRRAWFRKQGPIDRHPDEQCPSWL